MIVAPHGRFAAGHPGARRNVIPAVRTVVNHMEQEPFVGGIGREVRLVEERARQGEAGLPVTLAAGIATADEIMPEPKQRLGADRRRRGIYRLVVVERVGWPRSVVDKEDEAG